ILDLSTHNNASNIWKKITKTWFSIREGFSWCTGPLSQTFWFDSWLLQGNIASK
ncbi:hypothetical protein PIB30_111334, partial [Stylosanthes scabra]|nr:hypothetical protein [Stylosanthes scabra]